jgi:hypothetical protein
VTQQPGNGVHTSSIHFKRILNLRMNLKSVEKKMPHFNKFIFNSPIQVQEGGTWFEKGFFS